jgi:hypothetical protein
MSESARKPLEELLRRSREEQQEALEALWEVLHPVDDQRRSRLLYEEAWATEIRRRMEADKPGVPIKQALAATRAKLADLASKRNRDS